jgi:hypothetical protein
MSRAPTCHQVLALSALVVLSGGCDKGPALSGVSSSEAEALEAPDLGRPDPKALLGALSDEVPVYAAASQKAPVLGYLHAGATVARSERSHENEHCVAGWFAVAPAGYVCTETAATTNLSHPTLLAMALGPRLDQPLPYVYARTSKVTAVYKRSLNKGVELSGRLAKSTVMAIVGSWTAPDESLEPQRLGLRMDGQFVRADDLEAAPGSDFRGPHGAYGHDGRPRLVGPVLGHRFLAQGARAAQLEDGASRRFEDER